MRIVHFLLAASVLVATAAASPSAQACSQEAGPPPAGKIQSLSPAIDRTVSASAPLPIPKDGAIVFLATAGAMSDDEFRTKAGIAVTNAAGETVKGELRRSTETRSGGQSTWIWRPEAALSVGALNVTTTAEVGTTSWTVAVEDRLVTVRKLPIALSVRRQLTPDASAPTIACTGEPARDSCGGSGISSVASRMTVVPALDYTTEDISTEREVSFFRATVRLYGRTNGTIHEESVRPDHLSRGGGTQLKATYDEYCASITNTSVMNEALQETSESCVPNTIDTEVSVAEEDAAVKQSLQYCESPTFPAGSSAEDPTGRAETSAGGCAMHGSRAGAAGAGGSVAALLGLGLGFVARLRRRNRRGA